MKQSPMQASDGSCGGDASSGNGSPVNYVVLLLLMAAAVALVCDVVMFVLVVLSALPH